MDGGGFAVCVKAFSFMEGAMMQSNISTRIPLGYVGKSILESYSRVMESLAFNIIACIDYVLYVDDLTNHSDQFSSLSKIGLIDQ
ncbi:hypothetical protein J1N35_036182 [Gossypium stocksii]|uniref:PRONE domain-containing protein n=1 Tax=Gossypium stocksii TaxID=47602 RepID=A0A9D3UHK7_9ROSI|nr:hypothetical protein J1N35_036182 [Gossypium stocksii]